MLINHFVVGSRQETTRAGRPRSWRAGLVNIIISTKALGMTKFMHISVLSGVLEEPTAMPSTGC